MKKAAWTVLIMAVLALGACNGASANDIEVSGAWARESPKMAQAGAVFLLIENKGKDPDFLSGASTDVCETVELHESIMENDVMKMRPVEGGRIEIPARESVELKSGGLHIMLINLTALPEAGSTFNLTLSFEAAGDIQVEVEVRDVASMGMVGS